MGSTAYVKTEVPERLRPLDGQYPPETGSTMSAAFWSDTQPLARFRFPFHFSLALVMRPRGLNSSLRIKSRPKLRLVRALSVAVGRCRSFVWLGPLL